MPISEKSEIPKILHLYWGKDKPLSWLRWLTVKTFAMLNPDWQVIVWYPKTKGSDPPWRTNEHTFYNWKGKDWFKYLKEAGKNVETRPANVPYLSEVHRSDLWRWHLLYTMGGFWSDIDIIYFRPIDTLNLDMTADALLCWGEIDELRHWQAIGFLAGKPGCNLFKEMYRIGKILISLPHLKYQDLGSDLLTRFALPGQKETIGSKIGQIPQAAVYPFRSVASQHESLWQHHQMLEVTPKTIGVHWFAAQKLSCTKEAEWENISHIEKNEKEYGGVWWAIVQAGLSKAPDKARLKKARQQIDIPTVNIPSLKPKKLGIRYSIIMPYYKRIQQLKSTLSFFKHHYFGRDDYEVIIAHDAKGAADVFERTQLEVLVAKFQKFMPIEVFVYGDRKTWNPAIAFNKAEMRANGDYLVITNPECVHKTDVLAGLDDEFSRNPLAYVICACIGISKTQLLPGDSLVPGQWYQHSIHRNMALHFCAALHRSIYRKIEGFDPEYRHGMGFDDDDFRNRLKKAQVPFICRDDLLVVHLDHAHNKPDNYLELHGINKAYYQRVWGENALRAEMQNPVIQKGATG